MDAHGYFCVSRFALPDMPHLSTGAALLLSGFSQDSESGI